MDFREGQLLKFSRAAGFPAREIGRVEQLDRNEAEEVVAVWVSSPYQETKPVQISVADFAQVEELPELPPLPERRQ